MVTCQASCLVHLTDKHREVFRLLEVTRPYYNFALSVRQTSERKAQTCAKAMLRDSPIGPAMHSILHTLKMGRHWPLMAIFRQLA